MQWRNDSVDLYDCRTRSWYIEAAASPKDMLILVDNSGSMTGIRKEIARHVVSNILDTLGNNDFVNIFNFSEEIDEIVPCFKDMLVQVVINICA
jgi:voltage-dependent calcium channel alpha-2/delta-3